LLSIVARKLLWLELLEVAKYLQIRKGDATFYNYFYHTVWISGLKSLETGDGGERDRKSEREKRELGRRACQPACRECRSAGMDKKLRSTIQELGERHKTYSLDWKNAFIDILIRGFLLLTTILLLCNTKVWTSSCVKDIES